jgi:hypothetical protein
VLLALHHCSFGKVDAVWDKPEWVCVKIGERFSGSTEDRMQGHTPFLLRRRPSQGSAEVAFTDDWVVAGEAIARSSEKNPVTVGSEDFVCLRQRIYDGGGDVCMKVVTP